MFKNKIGYHSKAVWVFYLILPFLCLKITSIHAQDLSAKIEQEQQLNVLIEDGFLDAHITDSVFIDKGVQYSIQDILFNLDLAQIKLSTSHLFGKAFSKQNRTLLLETIKTNLQADGFYRATVQVDSISIHRELKQVSVFIKVLNAYQLRVSKLVFKGNSRNSDRYLTKVSGLKFPSLISQNQLERAKIRLERSRLFSSISDAELQQLDSTIQVSFTVKEQNPNRFDVVIGYIPRQTGGGDIIGSIELDLLNSFAEGNQIALNYNRIQPLRTRINVLAKQRYVFDSPFSAGLQFDVYQRDSTFQTQNWNVFSDYELGPYSLITGLIRSETTGNGFQSGNVTNGSALFYGSAYEWDIRNDIYVPTQGFYVKFKTEFGTKENQLDSDTTVFKRRETKQLFSLKGETYHTFYGRHVLVVSGFSSILLSDFYQDSDLLRFGGSASFRGYNEEQFAASKVAWINSEYRFLLDRTSYLFSFYTKGWFEFPELRTDIGTQVGFNQWIQSYGLGLAYKTRLGLLTFTYAKSPEDAFDNAKIHFSIRGGL